MINDVPTRPYLCVCVCVCFPGHLTLSEWLSVSWQTLKLQHMCCKTQTMSYYHFGKPWHHTCTRRQRCGDRAPLTTASHLSLVRAHSFTRMEDSCKQFMI